MKKPHIMVTGLRGFPEVQGGVETHSEQLYPIIANDDFDVSVFVRTPYIKKDHPEEWKKIRFLKVWAPTSRSLEAFVHSFLCVMKAAFLRPDVLHIQAIGPALFTPLARLFGLKVVVTHHGPDYDREKWGRLAKFVLQTGEMLGMRFANKQIVISRTIYDLVREKHGVDPAIIHNGINARPILTSTGALETFGLKAQKYVLMVGRLVPEKRQKALIEAFGRSELSGWKLVLVGDAEHETAYSRTVKELAEKTPDVIMTGFQKGTPLEELYSHAGLFVLPSSHEGLPIVLLEALSYGLPVVISDIPPHTEIELADECYFKLEDLDDLAAKIKQAASREQIATSRENTRNWTLEKYSWEDAARKTEAVYKSLL